MKEYENMGLGRGAGNDWPIVLHLMFLYIPAQLHPCPYCYLYMQTSLLSSDLTFTKDAAVELQYVRDRETLARLNTGYGTN